METGLDLDVKNHDGTARSAGDVFIGDPSELGSLLSATTLVGKTAYRIRLLIKRFFMAFMRWLLWLMVSLSLVLLSTLWLNLSGDALAVITAASSLIMPLRYLWKTRWTDKSTYVGKKGIMLVTRVGKKLAVKTVLFEDVSIFDHRELWYLGRYFFASWQDAQGRELFMIKGYLLFINSATEHDYHFYKKAVEAWSSFEKAASKEPRLLSQLRESQG